MAQMERKRFVIERQKQLPDVAVNDREDYSLKLSNQE